jgi:hypothetical protein
MNKIGVVRIHETEVIIPELEKIIEQNQCNKTAGHYWKISEENLLRRYYGRVNVSEIATYLPGRTLHAISCKARDLGLAQPLGRKRLTI